MGRQLRRVPLDFNWPQGKVWEGFLNPHHLRRCPDCSYGSSPAGKWLEAIVTLLICAGEDGRWSEEEKKERRARGQRIPHPYLVFESAPTKEIPRELEEEIDKIEDRHVRMNERWKAMHEHCHELLPCTSEMTRLTEGLAGRKMSMLGHDTCDRWAIYRKIVEAAGMDSKTWGICPTCKGEGREPNEEVQKLIDAWKETPVPEGPGYQLWETVSEGSPVSPVFATEKEMIDYLCDNGYSWEAAANFVRGPGWAPSMVLTGNGEMLKNIEMYRDGPVQKSGAMERVDGYMEEE